MSCVVFPDPVSPTTMTTEFSRITFSSSSRTVNTGRYSRCSIIVFSFAKSEALSLCPFMCDAKLLLCL